MKLKENCITIYLNWLINPLWKIKIVINILDNSEEEEKQQQCQQSRVYSSGVWQSLLCHTSVSPMSSFLGSTRKGWRGHLGNSCACWATSQPGHGAVLGSEPWRGSGLALLSVGSGTKGLPRAQHVPRAGLFFTTALRQPNHINVGGKVSFAFSFFSLLLKLKAAVLFF